MIGKTCSDKCSKGQVKLCVKKQCKCLEKCPVGKFEKNGECFNCESPCFDCKDSAKTCIFPCPKGKVFH